MVRRLLLLNGVAAVFAVCHHAVHWILTTKFWWTDRYTATSVPNYDWAGTWEFYGLRFADQLWSIAVPAFLFISGYFAATASGRANGSLPWSVVISRVRRLVPAYAVWSIAAMGVERVNGRTFDAGDVLEKLLTGGAAPPYYYLPLLVSLYVLSPLLIAIARRYPTRLLVWVGGLQLFVAVVRSYAIAQSRGSSDLVAPLAIVINSHIGAYSFWFVLGMVWCLHLSGIKAMLQRHRSQLPFFVIAAQVAAFLEWELLRRAGHQMWVAGGVTVGDNFLALAVLLACLAREDVSVPGSAWLESLGEKSYGVYFTHIFALEAGARGTYHLAPQLLAHTIPFGIVLVVGAVAMPVLLMNLVKASPLNRYYAYAFG